MKLSPFRSVALLVIALVGIGTLPASAVNLTSTAEISRIFSKISLSPYLANPSMILIDRATGEVLFQKETGSSRRPASVLKLLSTTTALEFLDPNYKYVTQVSLATTPQTVIIQGEFDPWMTTSYKLAQSENRALLPYLALKAISGLVAKEKAPFKEISVRHIGLFGADINYLREFFKSKGITAQFSSIGPNYVAPNTERVIASVTSPTITEMVKFALTWSDNLLAERLVRAAARATGFTNDDVGVSNVIKKMLTTLQINDAGLYVHDGSGLSKSNRVTVRLIADLLVKIRGDEKFAAVYEGLPVSGITGTLEDRYLTTAPQAVGLVRAKTGTLNGTVSLAGYVESGAHEYVFVAIADRIKKGYVAAKQARATLDKLLGRITAPFIFPTQSSDSAPSSSEPPVGMTEIPAATELPIGADTVSSSS
ncbi:MAG: D-alanyl-D-alanine carboxypeptidase [Candidatus Nanopelagicaceae bacterium]|nr:D-alanyl-D-alanine carboxypeptidase [Candidatus Nanopelagicaceae bacterium]